MQQLVIRFRDYRFSDLPFNNQYPCSITLVFFVTFILYDLFTIK